MARAPPRSGGMDGRRFMRNASFGEEFGVSPGAIRTVDGPLVVSVTLLGILGAAQRGAGDRIWVTGSLGEHPGASVPAPGA